MPRRVIAYGLVVLLVLPFPLGLVYLLYKAPPPGYTRPSDFSTEEIEAQAARFVEASAKVVQTLADERNQTDLDVTFTDTMINGHLRAHRRDVRRRLPGWITNPQVVFADGRVVLMADIYHPQARTVLSIHVEPRLTDDHRIALRIAEQKAGRVPLPDVVRGALAGHAEAAVHRLSSEVGQMDPRRQKRRRERRQIELDLMDAAARLARGEEVTLDPTRYHLRIDDVQVVPGRLRLVGKRVH